MLLPGSPEGVVKDDSGWLMKGDEEKEEQEERAFSDSATVFRLTFSWTCSELRRSSRSSLRDTWNPYTVEFQQDDYLTLSRLIQRIVRFDLTKKAEVTITTVLLKGLRPVEVPGIIRNKLDGMGWHRLVSNE